MFPEEVLSQSGLGRSPGEKKGLEKAEEEKVRQDDVMMWRGIFLYLVSEEVRKAVKHKEDRRKMKIGIEQPANPNEYMPEVVSFWGTEEWRWLKEMYNLEEQTFSQSSWGGRATKPTTWGGNLLLRLPEEGDQRATKGGAVRNSKELARWAPGMMREVAMRIQSDVFEKAPSLRALSWSEHVRQGHQPFRRDCQICQEASGVARGHRKVSHPRAGILSLDVAGPFHLGNDVEEPAKFMLLGTCTWLKPRKEEKDEKKQEKEEEDLLKEGDAEEDGPVLEVDDEEELVAEDENEEEEDLQEVEIREEEDKKDEGGPPLEEERMEPEIEVIRVGVPIRRKTKEATLEGMAELYMQLRGEGFPILAVHTDRGREFINGRVKAWLRSRNLAHSTNSGEDPKANGRVERAVP